LKEAIPVAKKKNKPETTLFCNNTCEYPLPKEVITCFIFMKNVTHTSYINHSPLLRDSTAPDSTSQRIVYF
ncbi:TPA: hypothetical protein ACUKYN_003740, partial [Escherichia coli]